jgi:hypothetical protein
MWLVATGKGTGGALTGQGDVETTTHWVAVPREKDIVILLLTCPAADYEKLLPSYETAIKSLEVSGTQTAEQSKAKWAPSTAGGLSPAGRAPKKSPIESGQLREEITMETTCANCKEFDGIRKATKVESKRDGEKFIDEEILFLGSLPPLSPFG